MVGSTDPSPYLFRHRYSIHPQALVLLPRCPSNQMEEKLTCELVLPLMK
jgi:hypothetical protein